MSSQNEISKGIGEYVSGVCDSLVFYFEVLIISAVFGIYFGSWWVFGGILVGTYIVLNIKCMLIPLAVALALCVGVAAYLVVEFFGGGMLARIVVAAILFIGTAGVNVSAIKRERED